MDARDIVTEFYESVWNLKNTARVAQLCDSELTFRGSLGDQVQGHDGLIGYIESVTSALGDYRCEIQETIVEDNRVFARVLFSGIHRAEFLGYPPTFRRLQWMGAARFEISNGLVKDLWVLGDLQELHRQLSDQGAPD